MQTELLQRDNSVALIERRASVSVDASNGVDATIMTRHPVVRRDERGEYREVLDPNGVNMAVRSIPVLRMHRQNDLDDVIGTAEMRLEGEVIAAHITLSDRPEHASVVSAVRSRLLSNVSVGYTVGRWTESTDPDGNRVRTGTDISIRELSFVAVGADPHARTRNAVAEIIANSRAAGLDQPFIDGLLTRGATIEQANEAIMNELRTRGRVSFRSAHNEHSTDNPEVFIRSVGEAMFSRVTPAHQLSGAARQFAHLEQRDIARTCLQRAGHNTTGLTAMTLIQRALNTTSDYPLILADTLNRTMRASYSQPSSGIMQLVHMTTANDFRYKQGLLLDSTGLDYKPVNEHGAYEHGSLIEAGEQYKISKAGRIVGVTLELLVTDNLGAFTEIGRKLGQNAKVHEAKQVVALLEANSGVGPTMSDTKALHHTDHGNLAASAGVPDETRLSAARLAMRKQVSPSGELISVTPKYLLHPPALETTVEKLLSTIQANQTNDVNPFSKLVGICEPRLTSATRWWVFADPSELVELEAAHLAGHPGPEIETRNGFDIDGVEWKVRHFFGCGAVDFRASFTNAGA